MHLFDYSEKTDKIVWSDFTYGESEIKQFTGGIHLEPFIATNGSVSWYLVTTLLRSLVHWGISDKILLVVFKSEVFEKDCNQFMKALHLKLPIACQTRIRGH